MQDPEALAERAAIMEYDGGLSREEAERRVYGRGKKATGVHGVVPGEATGGPASGGICEEGEAVQGS